MRTRASDKWRCIIYIVKRTQLCLEDDVWTLLHVKAQQDRTTVSGLVRAAIREKYLSNTSERKKAMLAAVGLWRDRRDLPAAQTYVRRLRNDARLRRISR